MEAKASLDKLRALLPPGIDPETQPTLLYIAANLAVAAVVETDASDRRFDGAKFALVPRHADALAELELSCGNGWFEWHRFVLSAPQPPPHPQSEAGGA